MSSGSTGAMLPQLRMRLQAFRVAHPDVAVAADEFGNWQAWIPASKGGTVITRYSLPELLDKLNELLAA